MMTIILFDIFMVFEIKALEIYNLSINVVCIYNKIFLVLQRMLTTVLLVLTL